MAATIIIYAGAIIVTFLFVLMLAQQQGRPTPTSARANRCWPPSPASSCSATLLYVLQRRPTATARDRRLCCHGARWPGAGHAGNEIRTKPIGDARPSTSCFDRVRPEHPADRAAGETRTTASKRSGSNWSARAGDRARREPSGPGAELAAVLRRAGTAWRDAACSRRRQLPLSDLSGPPPTSPPRDLRRDADGLPALPAENVAYLGRSLFTDYLLPVELGGTLLLVATDRRHRHRPAAVARSDRRGRMTAVPLHHYLVVGAILFALGLIGFLARRNLIIMFLCAEMMLQGVAINLVAFARYRGNLQGQAFTLFILTVAACEAGHRPGADPDAVPQPAVAGRQPVAGPARAGPGADRGRGAAAAGRRAEPPLPAPDAGRPGTRSTPEETSHV